MCLLMALVINDFCCYVYLYRSSNFLIFSFPGDSFCSQGIDLLQAYNTLHGDLKHDELDWLLDHASF